MAPQWKIGGGGGLTAPLDNTRLSTIALSLTYRETSMPDDVIRFERKRDRRQVWRSKRDTVARRSRDLSTSGADESAIAGRVDALAQAVTLAERHGVRAWLR